MTPVETVQSLYAAFGKGDVSYILGKIAPDARWRNPPGVPWGGEFTGPEGAGQFFTRLNDAVETVEFTVETVLAAAPEVVAYGVHVAKSRKTGKQFSSKFAQRWRIENGAVTLWEGYADTAAVVAALS